MEREIRILLGSSIEVRSAEGKDLRIGGYAAKFGVMSENLGGFREQIQKGAFADVLGNDVRALINHDANLILARTVAGTLRIFEDQTGLGYEADLPDIGYARDLMESVKRGDVSQSSFAFSIAPGGDDWAEDPETGAYIRTVKKVGRLYDVSPVTYPAYPDATVGTRSLEAFKTHREAAEKEKARVAYEIRQRRRRALQIVELKGT
jgi:HK97 family phage prohead protease